MAVSSRAVTIPATAGGIRIDQDLAFNDPEAGISICNVGSATVYIGGSDVTTSNGYPLAPGEHLPAELARGEKLYGIVATGTQPVRVIEVSV